MQPAGREAPFVPCIKSVPVDPQELHLMRCQALTNYMVRDISVKHPKDASIDKGVAGRGLSRFNVEVGRWEHDIGMGSGVHGILATS